MTQERILTTEEITITLDKMLIQQLRAKAISKKITIDELIGHATTAHFKIADSTDPTVVLFAGTHLRPNPTTKLRLPTVYDDYLGWCKRNERAPLTRNLFTKNLIRLGFRKETRPFDSGYAIALLRTEFTTMSPPLDETQLLHLNEDARIAKVVTVRRAVAAPDDADQLMYRELKKLYKNGTISDEQLDEFNDNPEALRKFIHERGLHKPNKQSQGKKL